VNSNRSAPRITPGSGIEAARAAGTAIIIASESAAQRGKPVEGRAIDRLAGTRIT
jgi:hypothetical protein